MCNHFVLRAFAIICTAAVITSADYAAAQERMSAAQAVTALKKGGYIIYFRHFETGADTADQHSMTLGNCATQRQLNRKGVNQAVSVRDAVVKLAIPVGEVLSSPFCRAWQSADLAFGRHTVVDGLKLPPSKEYTEADKATMKATLLPLLSKAPPLGANTVIMAHDDNMPAAGGPEITTQGEAVILQPDGKGAFVVLASLKPGQWAQSLRP